MNEIQEEISSFEPGVFEPTRRTLVRFESGDDCSSCPAGLSDNYCVSGTFTGYGDSIPIETTGTPCHWCGLSSDNAVDITLRIAGLSTFGRCMWQLGANDEATNVYKEWDGGNPSGLYQKIGGIGGAGTATISVCGDSATPCACKGALCTNQPHTMRLEIAISGTYPTSAECNLEVDYVLSLSADTGVIEMPPTGTFGDCSNYTADTAGIPWATTCTNASCNDNGTWDGEINLICQGDGTWVASIQILGFSPCNPAQPPFGGSPVYEENVGDDPVGTHIFAFDDPNFPTVHYDVTLTIT